MSNDNYIPPNSLNLKDAPKSQIRLGLQGAPVSGKTFALITAPNLVVLDFDRKMGAHAGKDITIIPFYDDSFVNSIVNKSFIDAPANRRDSLLKWLRVHGPKLNESQTLAIDSMTMVEESFGQQTDLEPVYTKENKLDHFDFWDRKIDYYRDIFILFKSFKCNIITTWHESIMTDPKGVPTGKLYPILTGQAGKKLQAKFTDWFRQTALNTDPYDGTKKLNETGYFFQTQPDSLVNCGCSIPGGLKKFVPATWDVFVHPELYK